MMTARTFRQQISRVFPNIKERYYIFASLLIATIIVFAKSCSFGVTESRTYHIAQDPSWYVLSAIGKEKSLTTFSDDLVLAIANQEHILMKITNVQSNQLLAKLNDGEVDGILSNIELIKQTIEGYQYSDPYYLTGPVLIVPKDSKRENWTEISNKIVGVIVSPSSYLELKKNSPFQLKLYDNPVKALNDMEKQSIDGVVLPLLMASYYTKTYFHDLKIGTTTLNQEGLRLITLKSDEGEELIKRFNEGLVRLKQDGTYFELLQQWDLPNGEEIIAQ